MTGLNKIISHILDEAGREAGEAVKKAKAEAEIILKNVGEECKKLEEDGVKAREEQSAAHMERIKSSAELKKRQAVLLAKQQVITDMLDEAYQTLLSRETDEYFALIRRMLSKFVIAKQGEIYFSKKDLDRMPPGFEAGLKQAAAEKGGTLELKREAKNIDGGFILVYGGVEENCSFKALLSAKKDELSDKVHEILFS